MAGFFCRGEASRDERGEILGQTELHGEVTSTGAVGVRLEVDRRRWGDPMVRCRGGMLRWSDEDGTLQDILH